MLPTLLVIVSDDISYHADFVDLAPDAPRNSSPDGGLGDPTREARNRQSWMSLTDSRVQGKLDLSISPFEHGFPMIGVSLYQQSIPMNFAFSI